MEPITMEQHYISLVGIGKDLELLLPNTIYLTSPHEMGAAQLAPFQAGHKNILLIDRTNRRAQLASVQTLSDATLVAHTPHAQCFETQQHQEVIVAFPLLPHAEYIIRMVIDEVTRETLTLRYQDSRADERWTCPVPLPVTLHLAPPAFTAAARYAHAVREILTVREGPLRDRVQQVSDMFCELNLSQKPLMDAFEAAPTLACQLRDISRGGMSVLLKSVYPLERLLSRLILCQLQLPMPSDVFPASDDHFLTLRLLGIIRHVRTQVDPWSVHIQFFSPLPQDVAPCFELFSSV